MQGKSEENWRVGQRCLSEGDLNAATSRLYYGVFQTVLMWARVKKQFTGTGSSVHYEMWRLVSSEGHARNAFGATFKTMRALRETADYTPRPPDLKKLNELLPACERMIEYYRKKATVTEQEGSGQ